MHEFVLSARNLKAARGVRATDVAKRLLDFGFHAPTIYFPLIVEEALMIEPTETESLETMDAFIEAMRTLAEEDPLHDAPQTRPVGRLDETQAARKPVLAWPE
jgi:glycine dehydrogenase subunit 2